MEQTRGRCPHILAPANTRTALWAWREDSGNITRILLTTMAGLLAQRGIRISDIIALCTRILLAAWNLHKIDHGVSNRTESTRGSRWKKSMAELLSCSRQGQMRFYGQLEKMNPNAREAVTLLWKVLRHRLMGGRRQRQTVDPRSRFPTHDCGPIKNTEMIILE